MIFAQIERSPRGLTHNVDRISMNEDEFDDKDLVLADSGEDDELLEEEADEFEPEADF